MLSIDLIDTVKSYENDQENISLNEKHYKIINKRREAHLKGKSKSFSWEQVKQNVKEVL